MAWRNRLLQHCALILVCDRHNHDRRIRWCVSNHTLGQDGGLCDHSQWNSPLLCVFLCGPAAWACLLKHERDMCGGAFLETLGFYTQTLDRPCRVPDKKQSQKSDVPKRGHSQRGRTQKHANEHQRAQKRERFMAKIANNQIWNNRFGNSQQRQHVLVGKFSAIFFCFLGAICQEAKISGSPNV